MPSITDIPEARPDVRQQNPRLPTRFVDHPRLGSSAGRAADVRLAGPHRARRRRLGGAAVSAGRLQRGRGDRRRGACAGRRGAPRGWRPRSSRWRRPPSGSRSRPTATSPAWRRGASRCWRWPSAARRACRCWPARAPACCWAGRIFLNYGLGLIALLAVAVLIAAKDLRSALRALIPAVLVALAVVGVFALAGFWWFDGYTLVQERYWQGIAQDRPFQYWSWANLASVVCAIGLGQRGGRRAGPSTSRRSRRRSGLHLVVLGGAAGDPVRGSLHAEQGRDRTHLAAVHRSG